MHRECQASMVWLLYAINVVLDKSESVLNGNALECGL